MDSRTLLSCWATLRTSLTEPARSGGNYRYELWSSDDNNTYYLKIWQNDADPETDRDSITEEFATSREALIYFDCNYSGLNLPECSQ